MQIIQGRRDFLARLSAAGAVGVLGGRTSLAAEGPPETATLRLRLNSNPCEAPWWYIGADLLRAEGFTDIRYVPAQSGLPVAEMIGRGDIDFSLYFAAAAVFRLDSGVPMTALAGVHPGCFELFAHEPISTIRDLKGKKVGIDAPASGIYFYLSIMAANVGLDPSKDINWVIPGPTETNMQLFAERKVDAFLGFPPEPQELRARKIGRVILNTTTDQPWSQYFCCMVVGNRQFVVEHPAATKRFLRAVLKSTDICAAEPEKVTRWLVDRGFAKRYDYTLETLKELPYASWREFDPEDAMRFYALRLHEVGMIKSSPNQLIANGADWRLLNEIKRELKA